jgi:6-phosphofructokinase 1
MIIGGWSGYESAYNIHKERHNFPAFNIPIVCLPASINNNLPGSDFSVGADTALNNIVQAVDKIKQSAVASQRCFVVEVMGRYCGYLALLSGLATGAERVYMHEEGITLADLKNDVDYLIQGFSEGKRLGLMIRSERANKFYTTDFIAALFEEEGGELFDVRQAILGHLQQGGDPSPFDRIQATRLTVKSLEFLIEKANEADPMAAFIGLEHGKVHLSDMEDLPRMVNWDLQRPKKQWWLDIRPLARMMAQPGPGVKRTIPGSIKNSG